MNSSTFGLGLNFRLTNLTELLNGKNHKQVVDSFLELLSQSLSDTGPSKTEQAITFSKTKLCLIQTSFDEFFARNTDTELPSFNL